MEKSISMKYAEAITSINPNFNGTISGNTEQELVINWNGHDEISVADIKAKITEMETAEANKKQADATKKASGKQKLLDLGLTEEEVKALIGV